MIDQPLISIVTPSYNQAEFLEQTILSVLKQDYPNIEFIIIDGGSTDNSLEIIRKYQDCLAYWVSEPDEGQTDALVKGFSKANGSILGWLCSDDLLEPSMVCISVAFHQRYPQVGLTFGDRVRIDAKGNIYSLQRYPSFKPFHLRWGLTLPSETVLFKRQAFEASGGLDPSLHMAMDYDLWCKMIRVTEFKHIPTYLGRFRAHAANKSSNFSKQLRRNAFSNGFPAEFSQVYQRHFGSRPMHSRIKLGKQIQMIQALVERRTLRYRDDLLLTAKARMA